jgi:hypothetical protein
LFTDQQGWPHFKACFLVSAKTGEGVDELREFLRANAVARRWTMEPEAVSKTVSGFPGNKLLTFN